MKPIIKLLGHQFLTTKIVNCSKVKLGCNAHGYKEFLDYGNQFELEIFILNDYFRPFILTKIQDVLCEYVRVRYSPSSSVLYFHLHQIVWKYSDMRLSFPSQHKGLCDSLFTVATKRAFK